MLVRFVEDYTVKAEGGQTYVAGETYDLKPKSAAHFIRKGRAIPVQPEPQTPPKIEPEPVEVKVEPEVTKEPEPRGGDPVKRASKAQKEYRKRKLSMSDE